MKLAIAIQLKEIIYFKPIFLMNTIQYLNNNLIFSLCPLCQCKKIKTIGFVKYPKMIFADSPIVLNNTPSYAYCLHCKSGFIQNAIQEKDADLLYAKKNSQRWISTIPFTERRTEKTVKMITRLLKPGMQVLDIGCSTGQLLEFVKQFKCETYGIESSKAAQSICKERGHKCFSSIEDIVNFAPFDIVFLLDTIEHIYDVPHFLSYIKGIIKSKGFVVLLTGNNNSIPAKIFKNNWWYLRFSEHIVFPSIKYLSQLNDFILQDHQNTYAFKAHEKKLKKKIKSFVKKLLSRQSDGHNFFFPDHYCAVLIKK